MSKTDKTKPWWVRVAEHPPWVEVHDHTAGICDLPKSPYDLREGYYRQNCHFRDWVLCYRGNCCWGCGCSMCTDQYGRKAKRRRERQGARRVLRSGDWDRL